MSEDIKKSHKYVFEKIHLRLFEKIDKEMELFKASYAGLEDLKIYNDWYIIGFYESYHDMLSCDFLNDKNAEEEILWLSEKEEPLAYLYNEWMDSDGEFSHNWDDMLDFIRTAYKEDYLRENGNKDANSIDKSIDAAKEKCSGFGIGKASENIDFDIDRG